MAWADTATGRPQKPGGPAISHVTAYRAAAKPNSKAKIPGSSLDAIAPPSQVRGYHLPETDERQPRDRLSYIQD